MARNKLLSCGLAVVAASAALLCAVVAAPAAEKKQGWVVISMKKDWKRIFAFEPQR